jgi:hypothetical protein
MADRDAVWLNGRKIATTRPSPKLENRWLGPFNIISQASLLTYRLTLPDSMRGVHPVFHVSVLHRHKPDTITDCISEEPGPIVIQGEEEWEVDEVLDCRKRGKKLERIWARQQLVGTLRQLRQHAAGSRRF